MADWVIETTEKYDRVYKYYEKKHPLELGAVINNLSAYLQALKVGTHPQFIQAGYIHHESAGIKALDQKGSGKKRKLQQTRLYIYPELEKKALYLISIGDKTSQKADIKEAVKFVEALKGEEHGKAI